MGILDLIFPKICVGCGRTGQYFCSSCLKSTKGVSQVCPVCERPSPFGQTHGYCFNRYTLNGLFSFFVYEGVIRQAIHQLKYKFVTDLENDFWLIVKKRIEESNEKMIVLNQFFKKENPVVVPIPLYWHKQKLRGFNQSGLFGERFSKHFNLPFSDKILVRTKNVPSQTKLTQKEREENVKGIFRINPNYQLLITNCLLVDDVWTTGSTLKEATRVLRESGVKKVWGITIAR